MLDVIDSPLSVLGHSGASIRACAKGRADQKALRQARPGASLFHNVAPNLF